MNQERNPVWIALALAAVGAAVVWLVPRVEEELAPELKQAWVAIEVEGEGFAEVGWRHLERGTPFTLHAVLEAQNRKGEKIYYTEAPALRISGEDVPVEALRPWDRRRPPKILWFTVEAGYAFRDITAAQQLERFDLAESFRPAWPQAWSIPGELVPSWVEDPKAIYGSAGPSSAPPPTSSTGAIDRSPSGSPVSCCWAARAWLEATWAGPG